MPATLDMNEAADIRYAHTDAGRELLETGQAPATKVGRALLVAIGDVMGHRPMAEASI